MQAVLLTICLFLGANHPLTPLTAGEIHRTRELVEAAGLCQSGCFYPFVALAEPQKSPVLTYVQTPREAQVTLLDRDRNHVYDILVNLDEGALVRVNEIPGAQPLIMVEELNSVPAIVRRDPAWQAAMHRRGIALDKVHIDAWAQGYDDDETVPNARIVRALSFYRGEGINPYGRPIEGVVALVNMTEKRVIRVMDRDVVPVAADSGDFFDPAYVGPHRQKPQALHISQPDGPSFAIDDGHHLRWQNWSMHLSMHPREGLVLYDVGYEDRGNLRSILWRASLSEMVVPYGDPDPAWSWRSAFDVGEYGIGRLASPLEPGVDVPPQATLLNTVFADDFGQPYTAERVVAVYERDAGLAWKHYDINTGRNAARRARELVISFVTTVGNYDYALAWVFGQDGSIRVDTELTGIMLAKGVHEGTTPAYAHIVSPGVAAPHHQHYFVFRLDMDVDGVANTLVEMNTRTLEKGPHNPHNNGMVMEETILENEALAQRDLHMPSARKWAVLNTARPNALGAPTGYALLPGDNSVPYARPESFARRRAGFMEHHVWGTRYHANELYAAGNYPNQSLGGDGLPRFVANNESLVQKDVVLWYALGVTHIPRPEEWPVMPTTKVGFQLVPVGFFTRNPALDLPP